LNDLQQRINAACAQQGYAADPAKAESLAWACKRGRVMAGIDCYAPRRVHQLKQGTKEFALEILRECGGNKRLTSRKLKISRTTLDKYLKEARQPAERKIIYLGRVAALLVATLALGCGVSPVGRASSRAVTAEAIAPRRLAIAAPSESTATGQALAPLPTNRPVAVTITIEPSSDSRVTAYAIYFGVTPGYYTNSVTTSNLSVVITNLAPRTRYYFAGAALVYGQGQSELTKEISWPLPLTNYVTVAVTRRDTLSGPRTTLWSQTVTNPPGNSAFFETTITQTNNDVSVIRLNTSTLLIANTNQP
jgi:hypothetical protein